ncbi:hypothetical protein C8Q74DRAFT_127902 [Fomes fomentarius]|nr:hypothetical protein C8Q74DRAFT_127902 [Fomes fomentarius]
MHGLVPACSLLVRSLFMHHVICCCGSGWHRCHRLVSCSGSPAIVRTGLCRKRRLYARTKSPEYVLYDISQPGSPVL